ncbi:hypothetical protein KC344_g191 [Hortaea werneckii]|nr:hypothetical protein KC344_g191 [Hortaea werneckii]
MFFLSLHRLIDIVSFGQVIRFADSPAVGGLTVGRQALGEFTAVADLRAVPLTAGFGDSPRLWYRGAAYMAEIPAKKSRA